LTKLILNELIKFSHKKGLYIWGIIVLAIFVIELIVGLNNSTLLSDSIDVTRESLNNYNIEEDPKGYVTTRVIVELYDLKKEYEKTSTTYYYVDNDVKEVLTNAYMAKYVDKNEDEYNLYMVEYNEMVNNLDNYD